MKLKVPLREMMLAIHSEKVKEIYQIPSHKKLHYNEESTQICVNQIPFYKYLQKKLNDPSFIDNLLQLRKERRTIVQSIQHQKDVDIESLFHAQFDYELLGIDHCVDVSRVMKLESRIEKGDWTQLASKNLLAPTNGIYFFEEVTIKELECLGNLVSSRSEISPESFFFHGKGSDYLVKTTQTRYKLKDIILNNEQIITKINERYRKLESIYWSLDSPKKIYGTIKDIRLQQLLRREMRANTLIEFTESEQSYLNFVGSALAYNEDNRILRSTSFYHIMKDEKFSKKFEKIANSRK